MPSPTSARTTTTNTSRCWPVVSSMTNPCYLDRRRDRAQNGVAAGFPAAPAAPFEGSERVRLTPVGHVLPPVGRRGDALPVAARGGCAGGLLWRTAGCGPVWRSAGCAPLWRAPVPVPVAPLRAQPAAGPLTGGPPCGDSGSGGAVRPLALTPASGHCRPVTWLSAAGTTAIPSGMAAPAAWTPPASVPAPSAAPPAPAGPRRAQRDAARAPMPGATTPAAPAVARRKP